MQLITTIVDCLRHGEAAGGAGFRGITDDPLTTAGWQQMHQQCADWRWDSIISSPLRRCHDFARHLAAQHNVPLHTQSLWAEIAFGAWEGLTAEQIEQQFPGALAAFYANPVSFTPVGAEPYRQFTARIQQAWQQTISHCAGQRVLLLTHAGPIRALLCNVLMITPENSFHIDVPHACMTRFSCFQNADNSFVQLNFHKPV